MSDRSLPSPRPPATRRRSGRRWLLAGALGLLAGCGAGLADGDLHLLAKADIGFDPEEDAEPAVGSAMEPGLRVATDEASARKLWDALDADALEPADDPTERGRHGELDAVDFDEQVVVLWRGGESGTCPERVDGIATADDGVVEVTLAQSALDMACTDDYVPYAVMAAVDRAVMPEALPARGRAVGPHDRRTTFPVVDAADPHATADAPAVAMAALPPPQRRGADALAAHPAWTVRGQGVVARPGDRFELADELAEAEAVTYRLAGQLDGQPAREWIRVPAIEREASLRVSAHGADNVGDARAGDDLEVRVVTAGHPFGVY